MTESLRLDVPVSKNLERLTENWTSKRVVLQYQGDLGAAARDRERMVANGYVVSNEIPERGLLTIVFTREPPHGAGSIREKLAVPGADGALVATSNGWVTGWQVELRFQGPDGRFVPAGASLKGPEVEALRAVLESAASVLDALPDRVTGEYSRGIGSAVGIRVSVRMAGTMRVVGMRVASRTGWEFGPALSAEEVRTWIRSLANVQHRAATLVAELEAMPP